MTTQIEKLVNFNGWSNYETWNVVLWMENDEALYSLKRDCKSYKEFVDQLDCGEVYATPDGVKWADKFINVGEIDELCFN